MKNVYLAALIVPSVLLFIAVACAPGANQPAAPTAVSTATQAPAATSALPTRPPAAAPTASGGGGGAKAIPVDHVGRSHCLTCHLTGQNRAPKVPTSPDHTAFKDDPSVCMTCHQQSK